MSKVDVNKQNKRNSLLTNAYDLFVNQGFNKTTISDIAKNSGLAKGTFYLYFKDKYDLRDELIARKSAQLLLEAQQAMKVRPVPIRGLEDYLLAMVDYVLNYLQRNKMLLKFISKNLSW
ncbi:MAG: TetR/AcrR family transcriptional regulator, partial [Lachnospiraceae bacterium]|nr:TetR/AcrR family transcriptional regulator [Lachnospiraceae bacterium]